MRIPWKICYVIDQIIHLSRGKNYLFVHIYREGNRVADHLVNLEKSTNESVIIETPALLPTKIRTLVDLDQQGIPNFRFKQKITIL